MAVRIPNNDPAHEETERILREMEKRIHQEYAQAERELQAKLDDHMARFEAKDRQWQEEVRKGNKTQQEYNNWRIGQMAIGERWENMRQQIAEDMHNTNMIARSITEGYMPEVYALNFNYGTYEVENGARVNTNFTMYDAQTVERLMRDDPELLPPPGRRTSARIAAGLDERWNRQQIQSVMMQGILQGESIPQIAHRLATTVGDRNEAAAIRNARTMTTGAQNAGRVDSYRRAQDMGVDMVQEWRAVHDGRTRHSHRLMDGQRQNVGDPFVAPDTGEQIRFPGDPQGPPAQIYNCRCTLRGVVAGLQPMARQYMDTSGFGGQTYEEWKQGHYNKKSSETSRRNSTESVANNRRIEYNRSEENRVFRGAGNESYEPSDTSRLDGIFNRLNNDNVRYIEPPLLETPLSDREIVKKISGYDRGGRCTSLVYAYIGNKIGYDVIDFRSDKGVDILGKPESIEEVAKLLNGTIIYSTDDYNAVNKLKRKMEIGKEYILSTGEHTAIVRKTDNGYEYLEMQAKLGNGFRPMNKRILDERFGCSDKYVDLLGNEIKYPSILIDIDNAIGNEEFISLLGYVNKNEKENQ